MSMTDSLGMSVGPFSVATTSDGGHPPEFWADRICEKLVSVSASAPQPIRDQALAYKESVRQIVHAGVRKACTSERTTVIAVLRKAGLEDAANLVWKMGT